MTKFKDFFFTAYADRMYRNAVKKADRLYAANRQHYYVCSSPYDPRKLVVLDRKTFRELKRKLGIKGEGNDMSALRDGSFYHTPDKSGNGGLSEREKEIRRLAYLRMLASMPR